LTVVCRLTSAPLLIRNCTVQRCPALAAFMRGVRPASDSCSYCKGRVLIYIVNITNFFQSTAKEKTTRNNHNEFLSEKFKTYPYMYLLRGRVGMGVKGFYQD